MSNYPGSLQPEFHTLVELLRWRSQYQPDRCAYTFLTDEEAEERHLTYAELDQHARTIGASLQNLDIIEKPVLLLYPPGLEYITAFFGCLYAGVLAVPVYPPRLNRPDPRLQAIVNDTQATVALTTQSILSKRAHQLTNLPHLRSINFLASDALTKSQTQKWQEPTLSGTTLAFLQYTSGSTHVPKGVVLSHHNLLHNLLLIRQCFNLSSDSSLVSWLPPYHDMGLIGGILEALYCGFPATLMSPATVLQRPLRWLQAISRCKATVSGGPNFAYDLCVRKITNEHVPNLDLSSWTVAFNGAEPIRPDTLEQFAAAFERYGFRREAFYPCYGLAEATLLVSGKTATTLPSVQVFKKKAIEHNQVVDASDQNEDIQELVSSGEMLIGQKIVIAHPETLNRCLPDQIGEIWVSGPSVTQGYWYRPQETTQIFQAYLSNTGEGPFLRTGDLGFVRNNELFLTGRLKDLIIIRGRNHYPQDIEYTVEQSHTTLRPGCGAAFSIEMSGEEQLVIIQEVEYYNHDVNLEEVISAIRRSVTEYHNIQARIVVLIRKGSIPKTSSGKVQRYACRTAFLTKSLNVIGESILEGSTDVLEEHPTIFEELSITIKSDAYREKVEAYLQNQVAHILKLPTFELNVREPLNNSGVDSLMALELKSQIKEDLGADISDVDILEGLSITQLATQILDQLATISSTLPIPLLSVSNQQLPLLEPATRDISLPLSFEQERLWSLDRLRPGNATYNIPLAIHLRGNLAVAILKQSLNEVVQRHESLRATFIAVDGRPCQVIASSLRIELPVIDLRQLPKVMRDSEAQQLATREVQRPFNLAQGPLIRGVLLWLTEQEYSVIITMHHIISDVASLFILIREIAEVYKAFSQAMPSPLPPLPIQYTDFVKWQRQWMQDEILEHHSPYWKQLVASAPTVLHLPTDRPRPSVQSFRGAHYPFKISSNLFKSLWTLSRSEHTTIFVTLLTTFQVLLYCYTQQEDIFVGFPVSGRIHPRLEPLIGFFAHPLPLYINMSNDPSFRDLLVHVHDMVLKALKHQNMPFAEIIKLAQFERNTRYLPLCQVMFNFVKRPLDGMDFSDLTVNLANVESGTTDFDLFLLMIEDSEEITGLLGYNTDIFDADTIEQLVHSYYRMLEETVQAPETRLSCFRLTEELEVKVKNLRLIEQGQTIAITATFMAQPVADSLAFWMHELNIPYRIEFTPYNQVFQQILDPSSLLSNNQYGINVVLIRFEDWQRFEDVDKRGTDSLVNVSHTYKKIEQTVRDVVRALKSVGARTKAPYLVCLCPASPTVNTDSNCVAFFKQMEDFMKTMLNDTGNVYLVTSSELATTYPVSAYYDPYSDKLGHIPYTSTFFTALGTMIARRIYSMQANPYKVIVLDCDQVLWKGIIGEDGYQGVEIDPPRKVLQEFIVKQHDAGMLICLCSKNNEEDVSKTFEYHSDMPLKYHHIISRRINWKAKSENIKSLAEQLQLGLDSFIYIDDDPVELADIKINCPTVLALQLPFEADRIPKFLNHVWAFDHLKCTEIDKKRNDLYRSNMKREHLQQQSLTLKDFVRSLSLEITISKLVPQQHLARASQLTRRTNQFNFTAMRRSEGELQKLCQSETTECLIVEVSDRFGDYGLVGVVIFTIRDVISVDTFLLSCRVLGRGVEHQMLATLGKIAQKHSLSHIDILYIPTKQNQPALNFLEAVGIQFKCPLDNGWLFRFPAESAAATTFLKKTNE